MTFLEFELCLSAEALSQAGILAFDIFYLP
jgi:hypothetical protein